MRMCHLLKTLVPSLVLGVLCVLHLSSAKLDPHIHCGACIAMIEDMKIIIGQVDKNKKLETGSYRIMPDGTQKRKEVSWATSELHLMELFETICNTMSNYAETTDEKTGRKSIIRTSSYDGSPISLKNVRMSGEITSSLKFACETLVEEHEEEMIKVLQKAGTEPEKEICTEITGVCDEEDLKARMWAMASAVMAGMREKSEQPADGGPDTEDSEQEEDSATDSPGTERERRPIRQKPDENFGEDITEKLVKEGSMTFGDKDKDEL